VSAGIGEDRRLKPGDSPGPAVPGGRLPGLKAVVALEAPPVRAWIFPTGPKFRRPEAHDRRL
jgi:hypothetical protein